MIGSNDKDEDKDKDEDEDETFACLFTLRKIENFHTTLI